jgi:outer membrane murein-binding lipoprotein Lpp
MLSTLQAVSWVYWLIGSIGLVGTGLLIWLAPTVLLQAIPVLGRFFLGTRPGVAILAGAICFFIGDVNRSKIDQANFTERTAAFEQAQLERDKKIDMDARDAVRKEIDAEKIAVAATDTQVTTYEQALLPLTPADSKCRVGSAADELRKLAGAPVRKRVVPMPKPRRLRGSS